MGLISRLFDFTASTPIRSAEVDAELNQFLGLVNGNIDAANLAAASVTKAKLATDALNAFLKLATGADVKAAYGVASINWPGGSALSNPLTVAHTLGGTPIGHLFHVIDQGGTGYCKVAGGTQSSSQLTCQFETVGGFLPGAGNAGSAFWFALR